MKKIILSSWIRRHYRKKIWILPQTDHRSNAISQSNSQKRFLCYVKRYFWNLYGNAKFRQFTFEEKRVGSFTLSDIRGNLSDIRGPTI